MPSLTEPALIPVEFIKGITVDMGNSLVFLFRSDNDVWIGYKMLWQLLTLLFIELLLNFWLQFDGKVFVAIQHIHRYLVMEVTTDNIINDIQTGVYRNILDGVAGQLLDFFIGQVIHKVLLGSRGLDGERLGFSIDMNTMAGQHLLPFVITEIDIGGYQLLIWLGWLLRTRTCLYRRDNTLQVCQDILLWLWSDGLLSFIVETIRARAKFSWLHPAVRTLWHHRRTLHEQGSSNTSHMETVLITGCPAKKAVVESPHVTVCVRHSSHTAIFTSTNTVAVQAHGHTSVGISCMDEVTRHVEVLFDQRGKGVVGMLVGIVGSPVGKCLNLIGIQMIGEKGRVVALDGQHDGISLTDDMGLHTITTQNALQFRCKVISHWS